MSEKIYVGRLEQRTNKFGEPEVSIGYSKDDLDKLYANLNDKGWVNVRQSLGKSGKPYQQINTYVAKTTDVDSDLPF